MSDQKFYKMASTDTIPETGLFSFAEEAVKRELIRQHTWEAMVFRFVSAYGVLPDYAWYGEGCYGAGFIIPLQFATPVDLHYFRVMKKSTAFA